MCKGCSYGLYKAPPDLEAGGPRARGLVCPVTGRRVLAGQLLGLEWRRGVKNPLVAGQEESVPVRFWCSRGAKCTQRAVVNPCGGKSPKLTAGGWPLACGFAGGSVGLLQGFSQSVNTLSTLSLICWVT